MKKSKATKRTLLLSVLAMLLCMVMLVGTTFAWFTDTASTGVNKIVSGNLKVDIIGADSDSHIEKLNFTKAATTDAEAGAEILWEPGCRYLTEGFRIANNGNLALKWKAEINKDNITDGKVEGSTIAKDGKSLLDVIDFYVVTSTDENADAVAIENFTGNLAKGAKSDVYYIKGVMKTTAGNDYQDLTLDGITITVYATQDTVENDSFNNQYDKDAEYPAIVSEIATKYKADASVVPAGFEVDEKKNTAHDGTNNITGTITIHDAESLLYFAYVLDPAAAYQKHRSDYPEEWSHTCIWYSGATARHIKLAADIDLANIVLPNGFGNMEDFDFDGQGHTIKNVTIRNSGNINIGLFQGRNRGISKLVVENVNVILTGATGDSAVGIVSSDASAKISNVTVKNSSVTGGKWTGGIVGYNYGDVINCTMENCIVSGQYKVGGVVGYVCGDSREITGNKLTNVTVKGENILSGKTLAIGKIVGNWNATAGNCKNNTFIGTTTATANIGLILNTVNQD